MMTFNFQNSYLDLPTIFYSTVNPTPIKAPKLLQLNHALLNDLNLGSYSEENDLHFLSGNKVSLGSTPMAQAYAGHQFGHFNNLGDGRAILLGEHLDAKKNRFDIQLKGSGPTPYSRRGDGRAALSPMLREYLISEAMHAFGIPTTRSLAVIATGEPVFRETALPGAILVRVAKSHLRVGTFQFAAFRCELKDLKNLADYAITRHFPEISISENKYLDFIFEVGSRQASLIAKWLSVGFIHGVMNTDNMSICGETIDYGPCAFMNQYDPNTVFSSIDQNGRYSYGQQKEMAMWNLVRFAETLLPLIDADNKKAIEKTEAILSQLHDLFESNWQELLSQKIGMNAADENATKLSKNLLDLMHNGKLDFNHTFSELSSEILPDSIFLTNLKMKEWYAQWLINVQNQNLDLPQIYKKMKTINPLVVPRNYLVEEALFEAQTNGSFSKFNSLLEILKKPFEHNSVNKIYSLPSASENANYRTFCGT